MAQTQLLHTKRTNSGTYPDHQSFAPIARQNVTGDYDGPNLGRVSGDGVQDRGRVLVDEDRLRFYRDADLNNRKMHFNPTRLWVTDDVAMQPGKVSSSF